MSGDVKMGDAAESMRETIAALQKTEMKSAGRYAGGEAAKVSGVDPEWVKRRDAELRLQVLDRVIRVDGVCTDNVGTVSEELYNWVTSD